MTKPVHSMARYNQGYTNARSRLLGSFTDGGDSKASLTTILAPPIEQVPYDISSRILDNVSKMLYSFLQW